MRMYVPHHPGVDIGAVALSDVIETPTNDPTNQKHNSTAPVQRVVPISGCRDNTETIYHQMKRYREEFQGGYIKMVVRYIYNTTPLDPYSFTH